MDAVLVLSCCTVVSSSGMNIRLISWYRWIYDSGKSLLLSVLIRLFLSVIRTSMFWSWDQRNLQPHSATFVFGDKVEFVIWSGFNECYFFLLTGYQDLYAYFVLWTEQRIIVSLYVFLRTLQRFSVRRFVFGLSLLAEFYMQCLCHLRWQSHSSGLPFRTPTQEHFLWGTLWSSRQSPGSYSSTVSTRLLRSELSASSESTFLSNFAYQSGDSINQILLQFNKLFVKCLSESLSIVICRHVE